MYEMLSNNQVTIAGEICSDFIFNHEVFNEKFYIFDLKVARLSDAFDIIPVVVSERLVDVNTNPIGAIVKVTGQYRSYNKHEERKNRLVLNVFAREVEAIEDVDCGRESNCINIEGYICKQPNFRKTPLGREITDLLVAVNRPYGKSDYIPCISWGRTARFATTFEVGDRVKISGRIQSREYYKMIDGKETKKVAYEVSVAELQLIGELEE